jgi:hypothetical protein
VPTDWLFYSMTQPSGVALIALAVAVPFAIWRLMLGKQYAEIGIAPLIVAYTCAFVGLAVVSFASSYLEFSNRVSRGILLEEQRWSTVVGWSIYFAVLSLIMVLPLIGLLGVPLSALLLRFRRLTYVSIAVAVVTLWLSLVVLAWAFPGNAWHTEHRFESFNMWLKELLPAVMLVGLPFLLGIHWASRTFRNART